MSIFPGPVAFDISSALITLLKPGSSRGRNEVANPVMSSLWELLLCIRIIFDAQGKCAGCVFTADGISEFTSFNQAFGFVILCSQMMKKR